MEKKGITAQTIVSMVLVYWKPQIQLYSSILVIQWEREKGLTYSNSFYNVMWCYFCEDR